MLLTTPVFIFAEFVEEISQFLILCNFTIYEAVVYQTQGILGEVVRNILKTKAADIPERLHYETLVKLCLSWTDALIRKRSPSNKLLTAKNQRTTIKWKLYVFVMAELLVDSTGRTTSKRSYFLSLSLLRVLERHYTRFRLFIFNIRCRKN